MMAAKEVRSRLYVVLTAAMLIGDASLAAQAPPAQGRGRLFPPTDLGLLEVPDRAAWQKPELIMDALRIAEDDWVADIGAGGGFFTVRLARRVVNGRVFAQDIQQPMLEAIKRRVSREGLPNVETRLSTDTNLNLPKAGLDAVLIVDTYQEIDEPDRVAFLRDLALTLKPNGRIGIVNYNPGRGGPAPEPQRRIESAVAEAEARRAGLRVIDRANLPFQYLIVLGR